MWINLFLLTFQDSLLSSSPPSKQRKRNGDDPLAVFRFRKGDCVTSQTSNQPDDFKIRVKEEMNRYESLEATDNDDKKVNIANNIK